MPDYFVSYICTSVPWMHDCMCIIS